ncbi:uncharacterized protein RSE6_10619 [Rhynchosporium secalis]|uniref:Uncharacterized protein n=1 Tax=Rhynchosporium secalis TaxID=38038 RepID=A0A1E1MLW6_RHYSE|nr:uncharacterized protein RSE6_10619 [Rhynchosporium secalis]
MGFTRALPLVLGVLAVSSEVAMLTFDIIFAIDLSRSSSPIRTTAVAIAASGLSTITTALLLFMLGRQVQDRKGAPIRDLGHRNKHDFLLAAFGGLFGVLSAVASAILLGFLRCMDDLSKRTISSSTNTLVIAAFIIWAYSLVSEAIFIICMVITPRKEFQQRIQQYDPEAGPQNLPQMMESTRPRASSVQTSSVYRKTPSIDSAPRSSGRSRAGSDTKSSFRSSFSHVVRPISSKTKLISQSHRSPYRAPSIDSNQRETIVSIEDGFDSWDTSAVDAHSREAVASASPTLPRFLETIPASPTTSRSASPGYPLDLEPPKSRQRSRSYSPANSSRDLAKTVRNASPTESTNSEAHIHPLFRTDSPTPPPAATPGTMVTAAPGAGQVISDRESIRSIHRMRSESLPSSPSPLVHSASLESIRLAIEKEEMERERWDKMGGERTLTPPIPDFVFRNSMQVHNSRRRPMGLGMVGEVRDE